MVGSVTKEATSASKTEGALASGISRARARLCVVLLVLLGFTLGCSEFVVIGIESDLATDLGVSLQTTGQLISMFALPYAIMTPVLALSTGRFKRYHLLVAYSLIFILGNVVSALASSFGLLLASRIVIGAVAGALLAVGLTFVPELVEPKKAAGVLSVVYAAFSVAMVIITSVGKILADTMSWHYAMYVALILAVAICGATMAVLPRSSAADEPATFREQASLFKEPAVLAAMLIFLFGVGSVYVFYGYITPYLEEVLGLDTMGASTTLMVYGAFTFFSNLLGGWIQSRFGVKALIVTFILQALTLFGLYLAGGDVPVALALIFVIALLMYLASVPCVSLFMRAARLKHPKALTLASSLEPMSFSMGISFGTLAGGMTVAGAGIASVGLVGAAFSLVACVLSAITWKLSHRLTAKPRQA